MLQKRKSRKNKKKSSRSKRQNPENAYLTSEITESNCSLIESKDENQAAECGLDRISDMPDTILHQILLCMPAEDAFKTSALSKRWRTMWATNCPILYFDECLFGADYFIYGIGLKERYRFVDFLSRYLKKLKNISFRCSVDKLWLRMTSYDEWTDGLIENYIQYALDNNVKELDLRLQRPFIDADADFYYKNYVAAADADFYYNNYDADADFDYDNNMYQDYQLGDRGLEDNIFTAEFLTALRLEHCMINPRCTVNLSSLKALTLNEVKIWNGVFHNLIQGCPLVEELSLEFCEGLVYIDISPPNLKFLKVNLQGLEKLEVKTTELRTVIFSGGCMSGCRIRIPETLKNLSFMSVSIWKNGFRRLIRENPLEKLVVYGCRGGTCEVYAPELQSLEYSGDKILFSLDAPKLKEAKVHLHPRELDQNWYISLKKILEDFSSCQQVSFIFSSDLAMHFPAELYHEFLPITYKLKHLRLEIRSISTSVSSIVDSLRQVFPGLETISIKSGSILNSSR